MTTNPNCDDNGNGDGNGDGDGDGDGACPDGLELSPDPLAYVCVVLLPGDDFDQGLVECPDGTVPVEVPLDPLVYACVVILPDGGEGDGGGDDGALPPLPDVPAVLSL